MTRIDVLLPYYGDSTEFRLAVESVRAQTHTDWRLVCVDDASPGENAAAWLASLADDRIHYRRNETNFGVAGNFAQCLALAEAEWFTIMGSDDIMLADHLSGLSETIERHPEVDIIQPGVRVIDENGDAVLPLADRVKAIIRPRTTNGERLLSGPELAESLVRADWAYFPSLMWKTRTAQDIGFDERFPIALDLGLLLDIILAGGSLLIQDRVTFLYRRHRASVSMSAARTGERFEHERDFFLHYAERLRAHGWRRAAGRARRHVISRLNAAAELPGALRSGSFAGARRLLRHIF